ERTMKPEPIPCCSVWRIMSGDEIVVLISTTAFPSWSATLITADSSVTLLVMGASGPMPPPPTPVGVTLIKRGATRIVAAVPARAPTSALITTIQRIPIRRRGVAGLSTGTGDRGAGSGGGGRN